MKDKPYVESFKDSIQKLKTVAAVILLRGQNPPRWRSAGSYPRKEGEIQEATDCILWKYIGQWKDKEMHWVPVCTYKQGGHPQVKKH